MGVWAAPGAPETHPKGYIALQGHVVKHDMRGILAGDVCVTCSRYRMVSSSAGCRLPTVAVDVCLNLYGWSGDRGPAACGLQSTDRLWNLPLGTFAERIALRLIWPALYLTAAMLSRRKTINTLSTISGLETEIADSGGLTGPHLTAKPTPRSREQPKPQMWEPGVCLNFGFLSASVV
jgi:hypothetical protein